MLLNICKFKLGLFFPIYLVINFSFYLKVNSDNSSWTFCFRHTQTQPEFLVPSESRQYLGFIWPCFCLQLCLQTLWQDTFLLGGRIFNINSHRGGLTKKNKILDYSILKFYTNVWVFYSCSESKTNSSKCYFA